MQRDQLDWAGILVDIEYGIYCDLIVATDSVGSILLRDSDNGSGPITMGHFFQDSRCLQTVKFGSNDVLDGERNRPSFAELRRR